MSTDLARIQPGDDEVSPAVLARRQAAYARVIPYIAPALAESTQKSYESHLRQFAAFCADKEWSPLPATDGAVIAYLVTAVENGMRPSSAKVARSVIGITHDRAGYPNPTKSIQVKDALEHLMRRFEGGRVNRAEPMLAEHLTKTIEGLGSELVDLRDGAIIMLGYGGAMRRSEIVALDVADFQSLPGGRALAHIRRSKTDQIARGATATIPRAAWDAVRAWWAAAGITSGPAFRRMTSNGKAGANRLSAQTVRTIVKTRASNAGLDGTRKWSGHSLRRGAATEAVMHGADQRKLMELGRWRSSQGSDPYVDRRELTDPDSLLGFTDDRSGM